MTAARPWKSLGLLLICQLIGNRAVAQEVGDVVLPRRLTGLYLGREMIGEMGPAELDIVSHVRSGWVWTEEHRGWIRKSDLVPLKRSIEVFSKQIELEPRDTWGFLSRARAYVLLGEDQLALSDYNSAVRLAPRSADLHVARASQWHEMCNYSRAIEDINSAIRLRGSASSSDFWARADAMYGSRRYRAAVQDYKHALHLWPSDAEAMDGLAWLLAACPDATYRNGNEAVRHATHACAESKWSRWPYLATLAAAHAAAGDMESAVEIQKRAIKCAAAHSKTPFHKGASSGAKAELAAALRCYDRGQTYVDDDVEGRVGRRPYRAHRDASAEHSASPGRAVTTPR